VTDQAVEEILKRMRVPDERTLFVLGCYERPATLYMQQVRALNLIYALYCQQRTQAPSIAVVGAGGAGVMAGAAAALLGWPVSIFDQLGGDILGFAGPEAPKRWLHPHIYEWPEEGKDEPDAGLCILNWQSGPANAVVASLRAQWNPIRKAGKIDVNLGASGVAVHALDGRWLVSWNGSQALATSEGWGARAGRRQHLRVFDIVILAIGFGEELGNKRFPNVTSYWKPDEIDDAKKGTSGPPHVLVSGTGDGGLIDVLRYSFRGFRHDQVLRTLRAEWLGPAQFNEVRSTLRDIEAKAVASRSRKEAYEPVLNFSYRALVDHLNPLEEILLRDDVVPTLTGSTTLPLTLDAAAINRFLFCLTNTQYVPGPLRKAEFDKDGKSAKVYFAGKPESDRFDEVVIRHGPVSAMKSSFPKIDERCEPLRIEARSKPDRSRHPIFDKSFAAMLADRAAGLVPATPVITAAAVRNAAEAVRPDNPAAEAFEAYRSALIARLQDAAQTTRSVVVVAEVPPDPAERKPGDTSALSSNVGASENAGLAWLTAKPAIRFLTGLGGTGKTTALRALAAQALADGNLFPVLRSLARFDPRDTITLLNEALDGAEGTEALSLDAREALGRLYQRRVLQGRVALLLDDFDAATPERKGEILSDLAHPGIDLGSNRIVVAARPALDLTASKLPVYEILPLTAAEAALLPEPVENPPELDESALQAVVAAAGVLGPQIAALIPRVPGAIAEVVGVPPRDSLTVVATIVEVWFRSVPDRATVRAALAEIAWHGHESESIPFRRDELLALLSRSLSDDSARAEAAADALLASGMIVQADGARYHFAHRLVQLFLAAEHIASTANGLDAIVALALGPSGANHEIAAMAAMLSPTPLEVLHRLAELPDGVDLPVLRLRAEAMSFARGDLEPAYERLAREIASAITDPTQPDEPLLRVAIALAGTHPRMASALASSIGPVAAGTDEGVALRTMRFVAAARLPGAVSFLAPTLSDIRKEIRNAAADALGELRDPEAVPLLARAYLEDRHDFVFGEAVTAIARIGGESARVALVDILGNRELYRNMRWPAAEALGNLRDAAAVPALLVAIEDESALVRQHAARALGRIAAPEALPALHACLEKDREVGVLMTAAAAVGEIPDPTSASTLMRLMEYTHAGVREAAALSLGKLDPPKLVEILRRTVADEAVPWRGWAARLMAEALGAEALPTLRLLSRAFSREVRIGVAEGLRVIPGDEAARCLIEMVADEDEEVRQAAVPALTRQPLGRASEALLSLAERDSSVVVRVAALRALAGLKSESSTVDRLIRLVEAGDIVVSPYAANTLGHLRAEVAIPALAAAWRQRPADDWLRDWFTQAIARIGGARAAATLRTLLTAADDRARLELAYTLRETQHPEAIPALLRLLEDPRPHIRAAARGGLAAQLRDCLKEGLLLALRDGDPVVRRQAAIVAPYYASGEMQRRLEALQRDPDASVAAAAKEAVACAACKRI
jgi:HEAT repeat protein